MNSMEQLINPTDLLVAAEIEVVYKPKVKPSQRYTITSSESAYELLLKSWDEGQLELMEQAKVIFLNCAQKVLGIYKLSSGGLTATVVDVRAVFAAALKANARNIILAHNHPSGNTKPSKSDIQLTKKIAAAGDIMDIPLLDHIIVTGEGYYSFSDEGLL